MPRLCAVLAVLILVPGCGPMTFEAATYYKNNKPGFKPLSMWEITTSPHSRKQKVVVVVRSGGVPIDVCALFDQPNRTAQAKEDVRKSEQFLEGLAQVIKEPDPVLKFELPAKQGLRVIVFNSGDRTPDVEVEIKTE